MSLRTVVVVALVVLLAGLLAGCPKPKAPDATAGPPLMSGKMQPPEAAEPTEEPAEADDDEATADDDEAGDDDEGAEGEETGDGDDAEAPTGDELASVKCVKCHDAERIESHDPADEAWDEVVVEMQEKNTDWISDAEAEEIIAHLEATYPASEGG